VFAKIIEFGHFLLKNVFVVQELIKLMDNAFIVKNGKFMMKIQNVVNKYAQKHKYLIHF
jgi:hypothetical protein